jgi:hypothetical protein
MLRREALFQITGSELPRITVDFSSISIDDLIKLKELLFHFCVFDISAITFNLALYDSHHESKKGIPPTEVAKFGSSVYVQLPSFPEELAAIIARMLSRTRALHHLTIQSIELSFSEVDLICQAISNSQCLRVIEFDKVPLFDEGFELLARAVSRKGIRRLQVRGCRLTDAITQDVIRLISKHTSIYQSVNESQVGSGRQRPPICLESLDFRENRLSTSFLHEIVHTISASPIQKFDLRDNPRITSSCRLSRVFLVGSSCLSGSGKLSRTQKLKSENAKLRSRLAAMIGTKRDRKSVV